MLDQASELRNLVRRATRRRAPLAGPEPHLLAMTSGKVGVGVTTLAVNLSIALVDQGMRVVLVDADLNRADIAAFCNLTEREGVGDILSARRDIHEVLERGPGGILVVPGVSAPESGALVSQRAQERLLKQIQSLGRHADVVLIDIGATITPIVQRFWFAAHDVVLVTTPEATSVMDCYATIKTMLSQGADPEAVRLIVNRVDRESEAKDVFRRIDRSSDRFLGREIHWLGNVTNDHAVGRRADFSLPTVMTAPETEAARLMQTIASRLAVKIAARSSQPTVSAA